MRLPSQKKVLKEDMKGSETWINPMIDTVNSFMESVYQALNKNITFQENVSSFIREFTYTTVSTYPTDQPVIQFQNQLRTKPIGVFVLQAYDRSNYVPAPGPVYVPWVDVDGAINVSTITGLAASKSYTVRLLIV